jgi:hypothetical protein
MRRGELVPLNEAGAKAQELIEARTTRRLTTSWAWVVGPALVRHTRLLRVHRGVLVLGCWRTDLIKDLRAAVDNVWPQIQNRIEHALSLRLQKVKVEPCDPPDPIKVPPIRQPDEDPLRAVLEKLRTQHNRDWTLRPR